MIDIASPWKEGRTVSIEDPNYHTAGGQLYRAVLNARGEPIALVLDDGDDDECPLNAAIIATAPQTLAAFEALLATVEGQVCGRNAYGYEITDPEHPWHDDVMNAREAIKEARRINPLTDAEFAMRCQGRNASRIGISF